MTLTDNEISYIENLEKQVDGLRIQNSTNSNIAGQRSMFNSEHQGNLIQFQLSLDDELERIDHLLRGHYIKRDGKGNEYWAEDIKDDLRPFNDYGVQLLMNMISFYLNRNTILSNYSEDMINWKIKDLGDEIADLIYMKYEEMGMDTREKRKMYPMIVRELVDTIHSTYLRAMNGGERESLRTARHVTQSDALNLGNQNRIPVPPKKMSLFKPSTWSSR